MDRGFLSSFLSNGWMLCLAVVVGWFCVWFDVDVVGFLTVVCTVFLAFADLCFPRMGGGAVADDVADDVACGSDCVVSGGGSDVGDSTCVSGVADDVDVGDVGEDDW